MLVCYLNIRNSMVACLLNLELKATLQITYVHIFFHKTNILAPPDSYHFFGHLQKLCTSNLKLEGLHYKNYATKELEVKQDL